MYQLIYYSVANPQLVQDDIKNILLKARTFNIAHNITGCLLYHDAIFLQILEGEEAIVKEVYHKIQQDERHTNIHL